MNGWGDVVVSKQCELDRQPTVSASAAGVAFRVSASFPDPRGIIFFNVAKLSFWVKNVFFCATITNEMMALTTLCTVNCYMCINSGIKYKRCMVFSYIYKCEYSVYYVNTRYTD